MAGLMPPTARWKASTTSRTASDRAAGSAGNAPASTTGASAPMSTAEVARGRLITGTVARTMAPAMPTWRNSRRVSCKLAGEKFHERLEARAVGRPQHPERVEARLVEDGLALGEGLEARAAVILAHAARA